jgi:hypothetical protein
MVLGAIIQVGITIAGTQGRWSKQTFTFLDKWVGKHVT